MKINMESEESLIIIMPKEIVKISVNKEGISNKLESLEMKV